MAITIHKIESGDDVRLNVLVYGQLGVGKTCLLGSAQDCEETSPMLLIDVEGGTLSLSGTSIDIFRPQNFDEIQEVYDFLRFENTEYKSVGIDSLTELQRKLSMGEILGVLEEDASYTNLAGHKPPDRYDWLQSGEQMRRFIRAFRDLAYLREKDRRIHVFFSALEKTDENRSIVCPSLPGALGVEVGASVDVLARLSIQEVQTEDGRTRKVRHLSMREEIDENGIRYLGKIRMPKSNSFPTTLINPSASKLIRLWTAKDQGG